MSDGILFAGAGLAVVCVLAAVCVKEPAAAPYLAPLGVLIGCGLFMRFRRLELRSLASSLAPRTLVTGAVAATVAASLAASLTRLPHALTSGYDSLARTSLPLEQADIEPLSSYGSVQALAAAAREIPPNAAFGVDYGDQYPVPLLFQFWLAPRPYVYPYTAAPWFIDYNEPIPAGLRYRKKILLAPPHIYLFEAAS